MLTEPCTKCGRNLLEMRRSLTMETMRGTAPLCPVSACPIVARLQGFRSLASVKGKEIIGPSPPAVFVGRHGYPAVSVGPLLPPGGVDDVGMLDDPKRWVHAEITDILGFRSSLIRGKRTINVRDPGRAESRDVGRVLEASRELALSTRPLDTEITLEKEIRLDRPPRLDAFAAPMGPGVAVASARIHDHANAPRRVDALVSDVHATAATAVSELSQAGIGGDHIQRLLSVGLLGERARRRLVPTRWSITATDDMLGKDAIPVVQGLQCTSDVRLHFAEVHGNRFHVILLPGAWRFDMTEVWQQAGGFAWASDWEDHRGRSSYASSVTGAYYAARIGVLEHLRDDLKRQSGAVVFREITEDYWAPLGVWVIREGVREAMRTKPLIFEDVASVIRHVTERAIAKEWVSHSAILDRATRQRTLTEFLT